MAQSGVILNVHHQLESILNNQHLIVQNQQDMFSKLSDIEKRLINVETCLILQQQQAALAFLEQQHQFESQQQSTTIPSSLATPPSTSSSVKLPTATQQHPTPPSTGSSTTSQNVQSAAPRSLTSPMTQRTESKAASPVIGNNNNTITNITNKHHHLNHHNNNNNNHHHIAASYKMAKHLKKKSLITTNHKAHRLTNNFTNPFNGNGAGFHLSKLMSRYNFLKKTFKVAASGRQQQQQQSDAAALPQQLFQLTRPVERRLSASQQQYQQKPSASSTPLSTSRHKTPPSKPVMNLEERETTPHQALSTSASSPSLTTVQPVSQSMDYEESSEPQQQSSGIQTSKQVGELELGQVGAGSQIVVDQQDETLSEEGSEDGELKKPRRERSWANEEQQKQQSVDKTLSGAGGSSEDEDGDDDDETRDDMQIYTSSAGGAGGMEMLMDMKMEPNKGGLPGMMSLYSPSSSSLHSSKYTPLPGTSGSAHRSTGSHHHHSSYLASSAASSSMVSSAELIACATDESTGQILISEQDIRRTFAISKSRGNFAALLVQQLYNRQERISSNVMGTRGKRQLSPRRMIVVKRVTFKMYPSANEKEEDLIWKKECVKAIDSKNRKIRVNPSPSTTSASLGPATSGNNPAGSGSSSMPNTVPQSSSSTTTAMPSAASMQQQQQTQSSASLIGAGAHPSFYMGGRHPLTAGLAGMSGSLNRPMLPSTFRPGASAFPPLPPSLSGHGVPSGSGGPHFPPQFNFNMLTSQISRAFSASTGSQMPASSQSLGSVQTGSVSGTQFASTVAPGSSSPSGTSPASTVAAMAAAMAAAAAAAVVNQQQQSSSSTSQQTLGHKATNTTPTKSSFHHHMYQQSLPISSSLPLLPPPSMPTSIHQPQISPISQTQDETQEEQLEETKESTRSRASSDSPVPQQRTKTGGGDNDDRDSAHDQNSNPASAVDNST